MSGNSEQYEGIEPASHLAGSGLGWGMTRRTLLSAGAILGLAAITQPTERAFAWSSWTNATSGALKKIGMGDCVHEDLVQISYARMLRSHMNDESKPSTLLNPWAGTIGDDARYATIAGDTVDIGEGKQFAGADDLATRLFRENLAYLRIGSFWNDAAANTLADFAYSCYYAQSVPKFSGSNKYEGAWDVGQHIWETNEQNKDSLIGGLDALVQFTMNDRNNFIHGMLSSTANHSDHLAQAEVKRFALQWLGVAYEYARTGEVKATSDVTLEQAQKIFKGFIDTYGQLDANAHNMYVSLKVSDKEASIKLPRRRLRLRALGMMCHTMEDFWCPAHTCRTYHTGGSIPQYSILAFSNYKLQNGSKSPMFGYHIPFDRYAISDSSNSTNWREALTRGDKGGHAGTEKLASVLDDSMSCLENANTYFNTLGMNETIACITQLLEYLYQGTAWDEGVRNWVNTTVMPTYLNDSTGQSYICDAGRRSLHTPTYIIAPIQATKRAYGNSGLSDKYDAMHAAAKSYDAWQRGAHSFYSGEHNTNKSKYIDGGHEGSKIWSDDEGETRLINLVNAIHASFSNLDADEQKKLLVKIGCNGCHGLVSAIGMIEGMLQEFNIDLKGSLRPDTDDVMTKVEAARMFFESGLKDPNAEASPQSASSPGFLAADVAFADEGDGNYVTADMAIDDLVKFDDGSYLIAVRDMDSLATSIMTVPAGAPGIEKLEEDLANLTITYVLETEFEDDPDYCYTVIDIDYTEMEENVSMVTGTVKTVSADKKSLVLDLNGLNDLALAVRDGVTNVPEQGKYICARCAVGASSPEFIGYDELVAPEKLVKVTGPVGMIAGSSMWILANANDADDGYRDYLQIDYGAADVFEMPREGYTATVYYHEEAYGETNGIDESAIASAAAAAGFTNVTAQSDDDDLNDSVDTPGYIEAGEDYGKLNYGNEVIYVANVIEGSNVKPDDDPKPSPSGDGDDTPAGPTPYDPSTDGGNTDGSGSGSNPATTKPNAGGRGSSGSTAKTADPLAGFNGLLSVAAVAGAALTAYSARRVANEKQKADEE